MKVDFEAPAIPEIAPVELLLMQVGLKPIISRAVEKIGIGKLEEMNAIPRKVATNVRRLVRGEMESERFYSDFNYRSAIKELAKGWEQDQVIEMAEAFPPEFQAVGSALIIKAKAMIDQLLALYPVSQYQTLTGSIDLIPADTKIFKFATVLEIVDRPMLIFSLMAQGALLRSQSQVVRAVYPTFSANVDANLYQQIIKDKSARRSFELPPKVEVGVKAWFGEGPVKTSTLQLAQQTVARVNERKKAQAQQAASTKGNPALLTSQQKLEAGAP